jgi:hypothetical protein
MRRQCPFMSETSRSVVPIDSGRGCMRDRCRFLTQVGDGGRYSCYPELPCCGADEASLHPRLDLLDGLFLGIIATEWLSALWDMLSSVPTGRGHPAESSLP